MTPDIGDLVQVRYGAWQGIIGVIITCDYASLFAVNPVLTNSVRRAVLTYATLTTPKGDPVLYFSRQELVVLVKRYNIFIDQDALDCDR